LKLKESKDFYSPDSIELLESAGIDFKALAARGTSASLFAENLIPSGLLLNENVHWITFHGSYDFAYLLRNVTSSPLPEDETQFMKGLETYFPNFYDVRYLINNTNLLWMKGSLTKIANLMDVKRLGSTHQAGSDSLITSKLFFKLLENYQEHVDLLSDKNKIFGLNSSEDYENFTLGNNNNSNNLKLNFNENISKAYNFTPSNMSYGNEGFSGMMQGQNPNSMNLLQSNYNRLGSGNLNNLVNSVNYPMNNQMMSNSGANNIQMMRSSNSPTNFNPMVSGGQLNRNVVNLQGGFSKNPTTNPTNITNTTNPGNMMYYPNQQNGFNRNISGQNFNNNSYSNNQGYNAQMSYSNNNNGGYNNGMSQQMYQNGYPPKQVGDYNNYMNQYYIQNGFKTNNNNIATI
jgi:CCR4-NOT transcription complex subunit 7/8